MIILIFLSSWIYSVIVLLIARLYRTTDRASLLWFSDRRNISRVSRWRHGINVSLTNILSQKQEETRSGQCWLFDWKFFTFLDEERGYSCRVADRYLFLGNFENTYRIYAKYASARVPFNQNDYRSMMSMIFLSIVTDYSDIVPVIWRRWFWIGPRWTCNAINQIKKTHKLLIRRYLAIDSRTNEIYFKYLRLFCI